MPPFQSVRFEQPDLMSWLETVDDDGLDALSFGVIGFDSDSRVLRYNAHESHAAALAPRDVIGRPLFTDVAQCMNNYLVAQRFEDARSGNEPLDTIIDFVLTWRMKPTRVRLRLLSRPGHDACYVLLQRLG